METSDAPQTAGMPVRRWARWVRFLPAAVLMHVLLVGSLWLGVEWLRSQIGHRPEPPRQIMIVELIPAKSRADKPRPTNTADPQPSERSPEDTPAPVPAEPDPANPPDTGGDAGLSQPKPVTEDPAPVQQQDAAPAAEETPAATNKAPRAEAAPATQAQELEDTPTRIGYTQGATEFVTASWEQRVMAHLEQHKRYPAWAQRRGQEDVVQVQVRLDRSGKVLSHRVVGGAGYRLLDDEAMSLFVRADPLPMPPEDVPDHALEFRVPIEFYIDRSLAQLW